MSRAFVVVAVSLALAGCSTGSEPADKAEEETAVARVIDGDTIETSAGERVRLVQIDAPEVGDNECYAREATAALRDLLAPGASIRLEADERLDDVDRFGRLLRYVHSASRTSTWSSSAAAPRRSGSSRETEAATRTSCLRRRRRPATPAEASGAPAPPPGSTRGMRSRPTDVPCHPLE